MKYFVLLYVILLGGCTSYGRTLSNGRISDTCDANNEYLKPQTISSYGYNLVVKGGSTRKQNAQIGLSVHCDLHVESATDCYHTLKISKCDLYDLDLMSGDPQSKKYHHDSDVFSSLMIKHPLSFLLVNGSVKGLVTNEDEILAILNLKRGIISSLMTRNPTINESDQSIDMRTDVQGNCPVTYTTNGSKVFMSKNISDCHFPSKLDWHYSPFSIIWNMSFVQMFLINSKAECLYTFNEDGLQSSTCNEIHVANMESDAFQTEIKQVMTLSKVSKQMIDSVAIPTTMKTIEYEFERTFAPTGIPLNFNSQIRESISLLVNNSKGTIEAEVVDNFIRMVNIMRSASDLKEIEEEIISCTNIPLIDCTSNDKDKAINYWIDALVQCNTLPCIRSFRRIVGTRKYVGDTYLDAVLLSWNFMKITDPDFFQEIVAICSMKQNQLCPFILSSTIHTFWTRDKELSETKPLPVGITNSMDYVFDLIGNGCDKDENRVIIGLKALGNLGNVAQRYKPEIEAKLHKCVLNDKLPWTVRLQAIDATRRFNVSDALYDRLLSYICNSALHVDMRILAYKIVADLSANEKFMKDLSTFLQREDSYQLTTFIKFHLKGILTRRDAQSAKFAKIIRRAQLDNLLDFDELPDRLDVSSHEEKSSFFKLPYLSDVINQFGGRLIISKLYDGQVFLPVSQMLNFTIKLFGNDYNLFQMVQNTRDASGTMAYLEEFFSKNIGTGGDIDMVSAEIFKPEFVQNLTMFLSKLDSSLKYAYNVDNSILKNLNRIRQHFDFDGNNVMTFLAAFRMFGDDLGFVTTDMLNAALFRLHMLIPTYINKPHHSSGVTRILEAFHLVPTLGGIPLNWTSDAALIHSLDFAFNFDVSVLGGFQANIPIEFSGAGMMTNKMLIGLPGFTQGGLKMSHTFSTSFDTAISIRMQLTEQNIAITPPRKQVRILSISRHGTIFSKQGEIDIEDSNLDKTKTLRCLDDLVPYTGVLLCRKKFHPNVVTDKDGLKLTINRRAVWELTADFPDKSLEKYTILYKNLNSPHGKDISILFNGKGDERSREMFFSYIRNDTTNEYEIELIITDADFLSMLSRRPNNFNGFTTRARAEIYEQAVYNFEYSTGEKKVHLLEAVLPQYPKVGKDTVRVNVRENILNITTPLTSLSWNRTHMTYPHSKVVDHVFSYKTSEVYPQYDSILPEVVYETPQAAWLRLRHHQHFNESNPAAYRSYSYVKTPKTILEVQVFNNPLTTRGNHTFYFNVTQRTLPSYKLKTFLNLSYICKNEINDEFFTRGHYTNLTVPRLSWAFESVHHKNDMDFNYTVCLKREQMTAKNNRDSELPVWWEPKTVRRFTSESSDYKIHLNTRNNTSEMKRQPGNARIENAKRTFASLTLPGWKPITLESQTLKERTKMNRINFTFTNPNWNFQIESTNNYVKDEETKNAMFKHNSVLTLLPSKKKFATYNLDGSLVAKKMKFSELFESNFLVYQSDFFWNLSAPQLSDLSLNISATSPVWDFLSLDLKQVVFYGGETMNMKHSLMDIDVVADWKNGYKKRFTFKSKDTNIIPNMVWKIEYPHLSLLSGFMKFSFPDSGLNIYALTRVSSDFKEIDLKFCKQTLCDDLESEPNTFISQYTYTLDDSTHVAKTVIKNPPLIKQIRELWNKRMNNISEAVVTAIADPNHPANKIVSPFLKTTIHAWYHSKVMSIYAFVDRSLQGVIDIISTLEPIYNPILDFALRLYLKASYSMQTILVNFDDMGHFIPWPLSDFKSIVAKLRLSSLETLDAPGPVPGRSYVKIYQLPVYLQNFNFPRNSLRFNKAFNKKLWNLYLEFNELNETLSLPSTFYNSKYTRFALLYGDGHVRTFDGNMFNLIRNDRSSKCSHLLLHNRVNGKVTVIREGTHLDFMFPQFKLSLHSYGEKIFLNDSRKITDVPIHSWDGFVNITRMGNLVEVDTFYHLNVKCVINEFCVFSTTKFTHNHFVGLFGNNNKDPTDDIKVDYSGDGGPQSLYRLSSPSLCADKEFDSCSRKSSNTELCYRSFHLNNEHVSDCNDIVPYEQFMENCFEDESCNVSPCVSIRSYAALCTAHGVRAGITLECSRCKGDLELKNAVQKEVEIIFLIDQWQGKMSASIEGELQSLAKSIEKSFKFSGYTDVHFGLISFGSLPHLGFYGQHTLNGKLMSNIDEYLEFGIKSLKYVEAEGATPDPKITFDALQTAIKHYSFNHQAAFRHFILVTAEDPVTSVDVATMKDTISDMKSLGASLCVISNYPSLTKRLSKMHIFRDFDPDGVSSGEINGQYSKVALKTTGFLFTSTALLNSTGEYHFRFLADEMVIRSKRNIKLCRYCSCQPSYYHFRINCQEGKCNK